MAGHYDTSTIFSTGHLFLHPSETAPRSAVKIVENEAIITDKEKGSMDKSGKNSKILVLDGRRVEILL